MARTSDQSRSARSDAIQAVDVDAGRADRPGAAERARAQTSSSRIDEVLRGATDRLTVPGVVAMAADKHGLLYHGAFGRRNLGEPAPMTLDTIFMLASMTKTVTAVAALQLVERGVLTLDEPLGRLIPHFAAPVVLEGFAGDGSPRVRPARNPVTLRHLLTHTSGLGHELWSRDLVRFQKAVGAPRFGTKTRKSLEVPLLFEPGERWEYSVGLEWAGLVIEAAAGITLGKYLQDHIFAPLGMKDTAFGIVPEHGDRVATVHQRGSDGSLRPIDWKIVPGEYEEGGGGLYGTASDFTTFLRMLLNRGQLGKVRILEPDTVDRMWLNHIGDVEVVRMETIDPATSNNFEVYPGMSKKWGLGALVTPDAGPNGRSPGSQAWGGIANSYFWLDPTERIAGVFITQVLPFGDPIALDLFGAFERGVYGLPI